MKKALLVVAHGSRREASNDEVRALAQRLSALPDNEYDSVTAAFLELAEPLIPDGVVNAVDEGAQEVVVLPYFLSAGRHVASDIPAEVEKAVKLRPKANIRIAPYVGSMAAMTDLMMRTSSTSYCKDNPKCKLGDKAGPFTVCTGECD
ncbi:MAG: CbiX/SirB N-terminal domain-containing protein [Chromatiales bacterium]|jgi:sirohydrochlorin ferrochelatase